MMTINQETAIKIFDFTDISADNLVPTDKIEQSRTLPPDIPQS